jgi:hypothetical protein
MKMLRGRSSLATATFAISLSFETKRVGKNLPTAAGLSVKLHIAVHLAVHLAVQAGGPGLGWAVVVHDDLVDGGV